MNIYMETAVTCSHFHITLPQLQHKLSNRTNWVNWWLLKQVVRQTCSHLYLCLVNKDFPLDHMQSLGPFEGVIFEEGMREKAFFLTNGSLNL